MRREKFEKKKKNYIFFSKKRKNCENCIIEKFDKVN